MLARHPHHERLMKFFNLCKKKMTKRGINFATFQHLKSCRRFGENELESKIHAMKETAVERHQNNIKEGCFPTHILVN